MSPARPVFVTVTHPAQAGLSAEPPAGWSHTRKQATSSLGETISLLLGMTDVPRGGSPGAAAFPGFSRGPSAGAIPTNEHPPIAAWVHPPLTLFWHPGLAGRGAAGAPGSRCRRGAGGVPRAGRAQPLSTSSGGRARRPGPLRRAS